MELNDAISRFGDYSSESNLALSEAKTKWMLVSTHQMSRAQSLDEYYPAVSCSGKLPERVTTAKILGVHMDEPLTWADHVTVLFSSCYVAFAVFPKLRNLTPYHVRQQLVESLVKSKLDYRCICLLSPSRIPNETAAKSSNNFLDKMRERHWLNLGEVPVKHHGYPYYWQDDIRQQEDELLV